MPAAIAARSDAGTATAAVEAIFALSAAIGPAMWQVIEQDTAARRTRPSPPFAPPPPH